MPEFHEVVGGLLSGRQAEKSQQLESLLAEAELVGNWLGQAPSAELRELLERRLQDLRRDTLERLLEWRRLGGKILFHSNEIVSVSRAVVEPRRDEIRKEEPSREERRDRRPEESRPEPPVDAEPVSDESVARLAEHFRAGPAFREIPPVDWRAELGSVLPSLAIAHDDEAELERIYKGVRESDRWRLLPRDIQRALVGLMASRLRRLQDEHGTNSPRIEESFSRLSAFSKREQPGYVIGLSRHHRPLRESWEDDAESYWDRLTAWLPEPTVPVAVPPNQEKLLRELDAAAKELQAETPPEVRDAVETQFRRVVREALKIGISSRDSRLARICAPHVELLEGVEYRVLRRTIRELLLEDAAEKEEDAGVSSVIPEDWRWWGRTRGRRAVMVGGDPREPNRLRIKDAFQLAELDWEPAEFRRNSLIAVRDRVRAGKVDLVIILGSFVGHDADEVILPACRERGVDWVHVDHGYGLVRLCRAIERFLDPAPVEGAE